MPPLAVMAVWPSLQRAFRKAQGVALGDRMDEVEILKALCEGSKDLLVAHDGEVLGGVILEYVKRRRGKCCIVVVSLFNRYPPDWAALMNKHIVDHADAAECYCIESNARGGVVSFLERMGWRRKATVMEIRR